VSGFIAGAVSGDLIMLCTYIANCRSDSDTSFGNLFSSLFRNCQTQQQGGGVCIANTPEEGSVKSCLFHSCKANQFGGGIFLVDLFDLKGVSYICFCLFTETESFLGKDIFVQDYSFVFSPVLSNYSFSFDNEWVETLSFVKKRIFSSSSFPPPSDSFGWGINESFPCETEKYTEAHPLPSPVLD
jgi:hypothetical protein